MKKLKNNQICALFLAGIILNGCAAAVIGGVAGIGTAATREKGLGGAMSDSQISVKIKANLYEISPELHAALGVNVQGGEVLLTGAVSTPELQMKAVKSCWEVPGVKRVLDNTQVSDGDGFKGFAQDSWITTQVKSKLFFSHDVRSLNYSIKTVGATVYMMGIAQNKKELDEVLSLARMVTGVNKVVNYIKIKEGSEECDESSQSSDSEGAKKEEQPDEDEPATDSEGDESAVPAKKKR